MAARAPPLVGYASSGSESEDGPETQQRPAKRRRRRAPPVGPVVVRPPPPGSPAASPAAPVRPQFVRTFPHVVGQWATFVSLPIEPSAALVAFQAQAGQHICSLVPADTAAAPTTSLHISLSRTVALRRHMIEPLHRKLREQTRCLGLTRVPVQFAALHVFRNDERTRAFLAVECVPKHRHRLLALVRLVDEAFAAFGFDEPYVEDPKFHISLFSWATTPATAVCSKEGEEAQLLAVLQERYKAAALEEHVYLAATLLFKSGDKALAIPLPPP